MKKVFKVLGFLILIVIVLIACVIGYVAWFLPNVGKPEDIKVEITPQRVERGKYIATNVAVCIDCHSARDFSLFAGPYVVGTEGKGGEKFGREAGFPGEFYARNITPYNLKSWSDGEIFRAVTTGVSKDGHALFPLMPYTNYGTLDKEDIYSIIAYIRTLPEIKNDPPASKADFPMSLILHTIPKKAELTTKPLQSDSVAYGKYLITMASCAECHTKFEKGQKVKGTEFGGGREFAFPGGTLRSMNITSHATGIGSWDEARFIQTFKKYRDTAYHSPKLEMNDFNTIMPWMMYSGMTEADLACIYQYLKTVKPIDNATVRFTPKK
jgi:mono/diheme cytochrome c family protein